MSRHLPRVGHPLAALLRAEEYLHLAEPTDDNVLLAIEDLLEGGG